MCAAAIVCCCRLRVRVLFRVFKLLLSSPRVVTTPQDIHINVRLRIQYMYNIILYYDIMDGVGHADFHRKESPRP